MTDDRSPRDIRVLEDPAAEAAERLVAAAQSGAHIALSGGSTPRAAYERAAALGADWSRATLWFGDERCVPPEHEHSNYGMAKRALLDRIGGSSPRSGASPASSGSRRRP